MNEIKQQQLTWGKGMTNVPGDLVCDDNACESEMNMIYRQGEHRPIQKEKVMFGGKALLPVVFVHKYNNYKHYISLKGDKTITWYDEEGVQTQGDIVNAPAVGDNVQVEAIGNTLVVNSSKGLGYYLWKPAEGNYKYLGAKIPEPEVEFCLLRDKDFSVSSDVMNLSQIAETDDIDIYVGDGKQKDYDNATIGTYSANKNKIAEKGGFINPFFVRYAVRLYDDEVTNMSIPILVYPSVNSSAWSFESDSKCYMHSIYQKLRYKIACDYSEWGDIVKQIVFYITESVDIYDTLVEQNIGHTGKLAGFTFYTITRQTYTADAGIVDTGKHTVTEYFWSIENHKWFQDSMIRRTDAQMKERLEDLGVFYEIYDTEAVATSDWVTMVPKEGRLKNLTTQTQAPNDYYSHCNITGSKIFTLNQRLHMINIMRDFWDGSDRFMLFDYDTFAALYDVDIYVFIRTNMGDAVVKKRAYGREQLARTYFFYPDPRAYQVMFVMDRSGYNATSGVFKDVDDAVNYRCIKYKLKAHSYLNGAYWIGNKPKQSADMTDLPWENLDKLPEVTDFSEEMRNQIWTSEVNNPWVFTAKGNNTIGSGEILGLASQTTALSQGQFGQYPMIAFCTDGIWAMQTDNEGLYSAVHPMSREICNNPKSITETDGYVFFTTAKGLMVVDGGQVRCVSEQMSGKTADSVGSVVYNDAMANAAQLWLNGYLKDCDIAYDYRDSLLWIFKPGGQVAFVYSMKDGTYGMKEVAKIERAINDYPDTLLQDEDGKVYSLLNRVDINEDEEGYDCELISRPMKLENSTALKTIVRIKTVYEIGDGGKIEVRAFASNDCKNWTRVLSLHGRGFKYWRFVVRFRGMRATDSFSGVLVNTQERYTARMR